MLKKVLMLAVVFMLGSALTAGASIMIDPDPVSGAVHGLPGSTVGWGVNVSNTDPYYIQFTGVSFNSSASWGTFQDYLANLGSVVIAPLSSFSAAFNSLSQTGLGEFAIDPAAVGGWSASGTIDIWYSIFLVDPNSGLFNPDTDIVAENLQTSLPVSMSVDLESSPTPEPATLLLASAGLAGLAALRRKRSAI